MTNTNARKLGATGPEVFAVGLGCMGMTGFYGATDEAEGLATIQAAIDQGVSLLDTGDFYAMGANEQLVGRAVRGRRDKVQISVKFGALRAPDGSWTGMDARPVAVKNFAAYSLQRLGVEVIDIYRPGRLDPSVPIEETVGAIADLIKQGYVRHVGLSEVGAETVRRAARVAPIADVQIEHSLLSRGPEATLFPTLRELGIGATLYGILSRGLLGGRTANGPSDFRTYLPRFNGENRAHNDQLVGKLRRFAEGRGQTPAQLALSWVLAKQPSFVPLVGPRTREQLSDLLAALHRPLSQEDVQEVERLVPADAAAGTRYPEAQMAHLDSERDAQVL